MVRIGEVFWTASVKGADEASNSASQLDDAMAGVAGSGAGAAAAQNDYGEATAEANEETERSTFLTGALDVAQSLLGSTLFFTANSFSVASTAATVYSGAMTTAAATSAKLSAVVTVLGGALGTLKGLGAGFISWLAAGSASALAFAATLGFGIGLLGVFALEISGAGDKLRQFGNYLGSQLPAAASDGLILLIAAFAGPLTVIGGMIKGFVQGYLEGGLMGGLRGAVQGGKDMLGIFAGAFDRTLSRIQGAIRGWVTGAQENVDSVASYFASLPGRVQNALTGFGQGAAEVFASGWNSVIPNEVGLPQVEVGDRTFGGGSIDLPQLREGGRIVESGIAEVHRGEAVIPRPLVEAATRAPDRVSDMAQSRVVVEDRSGDGSGGDGDTENHYDIDIGDQSLDLDNVSRSTLRTLASMIDREIGGDTTNQAGGR